MPLDRLTRLDPLQLGRFRILARLGGGGMGNVYLAEADDGMPAALKVIKAELAQDTQFRARFRREVEAGRRVNNRCIARYLDADTYAASPWLATEFVPGPTLHHQVFAVGPIGGPRVVGLATGLADALVAIHAAGLVHRDLKPANVLLAPSAPKVIDFGISLAADATVLTTTGTLVGSPAYMSPEQAKGTRDVGPPADVFSWASCMTFACRRLPPFGEGEAAGLLYKVVHEAPDLAGVPSGLLPFVQAALDKHPANRPTAVELVAGLTAVLDGAPAAALLQPAAVGGPPRVVTPTSLANAGRVLAVTWAPDQAAVEEAERTLSEAHELRASLPARAEERQRRERHRANRAVFAAMFIALIALLAVAFVTLRPGRTESAKALDNGQGPDAQLSTTTSGTVPNGATGADPGGSTTAPGYDGGTIVTGGAPPAGGAADPGQPGGAAPGGGGTTPPSNAPTTSAGPPPSSPVATSPMTCTARVTNPVPGAPPNRLPRNVSYSINLSVSAGYPASSLVLTRQSPIPPQAPDAWSREIPAGRAGGVTIGSFLMQGGTGATTGSNPVIHQDPVDKPFALQLRYGGRSVGCGTFAAS